MTLPELLVHLGELYGQRNRLYLPEPMRRIGFFSLAVADLQNVIRKHSDRRDWLTIACARCVARIIAIAEYFGTEFPFVEMLCRKYPPGHCSYCHAKPCVCLSDQRPAFQLQSEIPPDMLTWTLSDWCRHLAGVYGSQNQQQDILLILNRLHAEISEFLALCMQQPSELRRSTQRIYAEYALELADITAWTIAITNYYRLDLESVVLERYGATCWKCHAIPCSCGQFNLFPVDWPALDQS